jgi:hypothetical protein
MEWTMRRLWLLSLIALPFIVGGTTSFPTRANSQDVFGLMTAPLRMMRNLGVRGRVSSRRHQARPAAARGGDTRREAAAAAGAAGAAGVAGAAASQPLRMQAAYWPEAYDDLVGFAFAPGKDERFWAHGPFDILTGTLAPSATTRAGLRGRAEQTRTDPDAICADGEKAAVDAATATYRELEDRVQPTAEQRATFDALRDAFAGAAKRINASCAAGYATAPPPERLAILADRLAAMRQAMLMVRTPLDAAYGKLSDAQKTALDGPAPAAVTCTGDLAAAGSWPGNDIARALSPNEAQGAALEKLRLTYMGMAQGMQSSCPQQPVTTALARLDVAGDRLNAMLYATRLVNRSLNAAYATLDNDQKTRLQMVGRSLRVGGPRAAELGR